MLFYCAILPLRKVTEPGLKVQMGLENSKSPQNDVFWGYSKNLIHSDIHDFLLQHESVNGLLTFCKKSILGKNLVLES